ncbi:MAG: c-type cytochrome [Solirubrobacterales bacterium]|nr:c-type cytochrome [Solirubrobacterales bacterium]
MPRPPLRRQGRARLSVLALALGGFVFMTGCDASEDSDLERGRALFLQNCGTCHTLAEAGSSADVGPDLDASFAQARADGMDSDTVEGVVQKQISNPREVEEGAPNYSSIFMPADLVVGQDAEDVAAYVASVAGIPGAKPPELPPDQLFTERCGSCHALQAAGTSGTTGPDLDETLAGKNAKYIEQQIVDPNSQITQGFGPDVMPQDFESSLTPQDLQGLVDYLLENVGS